MANNIMDYTFLLENLLFNINWRIDFGYIFLYRAKLERERAEWEANTNTLF